MNKRFSFRFLATASATSLIHKILLTLRLRNAGHSATKEMIVAQLPGAFDKKTKAPAKKTATKKKAAPKKEAKKK